MKFLVVSCNLEKSFFLNINKPKGITSFDVVAKLRKILNIKKIGHAGTLDPLAQGVLPVAIGKYTRLIEYLDDDKEYIAKIKFGENSTTYDDEGEKTFIKNPDFSLSDLENAIKCFTGEIEQKPPMYSAIKIKGQKLYELARKGKEIEVPKRKVEIYDIKILNFELPYCEIKVSCSKGTYIRSLAYDLGEKLACGAYILELKRTKVGKFQIENSQNIEDDLIKILPKDVLPFEEYELNDVEYEKIMNGIPIETTLMGDDRYLSLIYDKKVVSISKKFGNIIKVEKNLKG
ncbi:MAG: tRNA pseudouridine(55) synthase TruB [Cyanobacteria bacterium SIG30]|nr:tRNA pseudouridine(55) synthase TruB [Cyanobacteria bacterium SIG30]